MLRAPLVIIFITVLIDLLGYGMVAPLLPFYVQNQAGGALLVGWLGSSYALMQLLSGPLLGALSDRYGRRPVLLGCLLGTAAAFLLLGFSASLEMVFAAVLMDGITGGNLTIAYAYIADVTPAESRSRGIGMVGAAFGLGLIGGPALGGWLSAYGLHLPAFTAAGLALGNVLFGLLALPETLPPAGRAQSTAWRSVHFFNRLREMFRIESIRVLLLAIFTLNLAFAGLQNNFPLYSQARFHWSGTQNGALFAFVGVCAALVQGVLYRWIQPQTGEKRLALTGLGLMALGLAGVASAPAAWMLFPLIALVALGSGLSIPSLTGLVSNRVEAGAQGRLMGGMQALLSLTMIGGPALAGFTFEQVGISAPYWLGSLLALAALLLAAAGLRGAETSPPVTTSGEPLPPPN